MRIIVEDDPLCAVCGWKNSLGVCGQSLKLQDLIVYRRDAQGHYGGGSRERDDRVTR